MEEHYERPYKRRKVEQDESGSTFKETITRADQLHQWLEFQQNPDPSIKSGLIAFKDYLVSVAYLENVAQQSKQLRILREYCEWQKAPAEDQVNFYDLLSTWSFAVDSNAEAILSAVPSALAQFLKTISGSLELRPFGLALIDSLLRRDQAKLFEKCLTSPKSKPHMASPCLRLLTEMVSFDAGARANEVWIRRDLFLGRFDALLEQQNSSTDAAERRKPSVRRMALRLLLALVRYLDAAAKAELLVQARTLHTCLRGLQNDGDDILVDTLVRIRQFLVDDEGIARDHIVRFFNLPHMDHLAALYKVQVDDEGAKESVRSSVHELLLVLCTKSKGIVLNQHGWYPFSSSIKPNQRTEDDYIDLGLDSPIHFDDYKDKVPVTNTVLSAFAQKLRPHEDILQSKLLLSLFKAVPELVADYFSRRRQIFAPSSDDVAWRGQFAFLFSTIELPIPKSLNCSDQALSEPPPLDIVVQSIAPRPLDRAYLTKLISSKDEILRVSGARILIVALKKFGDVLDTFSRLSTSNEFLWDQADSRLGQLVEASIPTARDISLAVQHASTSEAASYTALLECLSMYHQFLPDVAATSGFDVSPILRELCTKVEESSNHSETALEQLSLCVEIADMSTSTRWLHKADNQSLSPVSRLLQLAITMDNRDDAKTILRIIRKVLGSRGVLCQSQPSFEALCQSLAPSKKFSPSSDLFLFLDNCITRTSQKPVKYLDEIETASKLVSDKKPLSLVVGAVAEQWSYVIQNHESSKDVIKNIAVWVVNFFAMLDSAGENYRAIMHFQDNMLKSCAPTSKAKKYLEEALEKSRKKPHNVELPLGLEAASAKVHNSVVPNDTHHDRRLTEVDQMATDLTAMPESLEGLDKWPVDFDIELEIQSQRLAKLLLCTSSPDEEVSRQAYQILQGIVHTVDTTSTYSRKQQVYLLLGEVCETIRQSRLEQPLPSLIPELACALLPVLVQPTHKMFSKVNKFLIHKPSWTANGIVKYWTNAVFLREPESDEQDAWNSEITWVLSWLRGGLRTPNDMDLYRRTNIWERVLSLYSGPCVLASSRKTILALLSRGISVSSDMLWTRFGVHSWLKTMCVIDSVHEKELKILLQRMEDETDEELVRSWKTASALTRHDRVKKTEA